MSEQLVIIPLNVSAKGEVLSSNLADGVQVIHLFEPDGESRECALSVWFMVSDILVLISD